MKTDKMYSDAFQAGLVEVSKKLVNCETLRTKDKELMRQALEALESNDEQKRTSAIAAIQEWLK